MNKEAVDQSTRRSVLLVATLGSFLTPFMGSAVNVALPSMGADLGMDSIELTWVASAFLLSSAVGLIPAGRLADRVGRKRILLIGVGAFTFACLLCALAWSPTAMIVFRALQGLGGSMIFATGAAILVSVFPAGERGRALGLNAASVYLGLSLGPSLGGVLVRHLGWRSVFLSNVPLGLMIVAAIWWRVRAEWSGSPTGRFDFVGAGAYGVSLIALMYGFSRLTTGLLGFVLVAAAALGFGLFVYWEGRAADPLFDVRLFRRNVVFALSNAAAFINYSATFAVGFLLSLYLQYVKGLDAQQTGLLLIAQPIVMALVSPFAGRLSDRTEPRIVASLGMGLTAVGLGLLTLLSFEASELFIGAALVILGCGFGLFSSPNTNAVMSSVEPRHFGVASATIATMRMTGQMFSMGLATLALAVYVGRVKVTSGMAPQLLGGLRSSFAIFAALCCIGVVASLARGRVRPG